MSGVDDTAALGGADADACPVAAQGNDGESKVAAPVAGQAHGTAAPDSAGSAPIGITFKLYATLQDLLPAGTRRNAAPIEVPADATLNQIIDRFKVPRELAHLVLVNGHFRCEADRDERGTLKEGDVLAIWPPVAGG